MSYTPLPYVVRQYVRAAVGYAFLSSQYFGVGNPQMRAQANYHLGLIETEHGPTWGRLVLGDLFGWVDSKTATS
jgi:hypothetical protein